MPALPARPSGTKERLSIQEFCRRTKKFSETGDRMLILPTQLTKWRKDMMPSARAAMVTARVFGVSRSFFYLVGENIMQGKKPPPVEDDYLALSRLALVRDALKTVDETHRLLRGLEETIAPRTDAEAVKAGGGEDAPPPPGDLASRGGERVDRRRMPLAKTSY